MNKDNPIEPQPGDFFNGFGPKIYAKDEMRGGSRMYPTNPFRLYVSHLLAFELGKIAPDLEGPPLNKLTEGTYAKDGKWIQPIAVGILRCRVNEEFKPSRWREALSYNLVLVTSLVIGGGVAFLGLNELNGLGFLSNDLVRLSGEMVHRSTVDIINNLGKHIFAPDVLNAISTFVTSREAIIAFLAIIGFAGSTIAKRLIGNAKLDVAHQILDHYIELADE
ncbi:hypothetical protein IPJ91_00225 [bacterium]|nr:MAG: hypothetical protein IPJ91_00225 [bacterium]